MANDILESGAGSCPASAFPNTRRVELGRKLWLKLHRTLGLVLGAQFVLVGLSGSLLAFRQPVDEWLNAALMRVEVPPQTAYRPLDEIFAAAKRACPQFGVPERLKMPRLQGLAATVTCMVPAGDIDMDSYEIFADPYTAKVTGRRLTLHGDNLLSQPFVRIVMDFHWTLLLGANRAYIVGIPAICLFVSILAGLCLWWPRNGNWRQAFTIKWGATPERIAYDLHKAIGIYFAAVLLVTLFSGISMIFKPQARALAALFSPLNEELQGFKSTPVPGRPPLGLEAVAAIASTVFPDGKLHEILLPEGPDGVYVAGKQADGEPNRSITNRNVTIDQYSGQILHVQDRNNFTAGETFLEWQYPLHCGEAFGNAGRAVVMALGFAPLVLYATGFLRWRQKRRARR